MFVIIVLPLSADSHLRDHSEKKKSTYFVLCQNMFIEVNAVCH
jgi:hypothetical protein